MTFGDCYEGFLHIANGAGYTSDDSISDRGTGIWQSRWRFRVYPQNRHPARYRLHAEIQVEEGSAAKGWLLRFAIEQEVVDDLRRSIEPREEDWSSKGQDSEGEAILAEALVRRIGPMPTRPEPGKAPANDR
jgi:hypothetical protein